MMIDTGASNTFISKEWMKNNNIHYYPYTPNEINGCNVELYCSNVNMVIGNICFPNKFIIVRPAIGWIRNSFYGCLGMDILRELPFTLNLINREKSHWGAFSVDDTFKKLECDFDCYGLPHAYITLRENKCYCVLFDTAAHKSMLSSKIVTNIERDVNSKPVPYSDTLGHKELYYESKRMIININRDIILPNFKPVITSGSEMILGIDAFDRFIIHHDKQNMFYVLDSSFHSNT